MDRSQVNLLVFLSDSTLQTGSIWSKVIPLNLGVLLKVCICMIKNLTVLMLIIPRGTRKIRAPQK